MENPTNIRELIRQTKANLQWPLRVHRGGDGLEVFSDPEHRVHTLYYPERGSTTLIEVLRNLGHATLAERVHQVFGGAVFEPIEEHRQTLAAVFQASSQWFAEGWLMAVLPKEAQLDLVMRLSRPEDQPDRFRMALLVAEGIHYLGRDLRRGDQGLVEAFLAVTPEQPSLDAYMRLANLLLANLPLAGACLQAVLTDEGSWVIKGICPKK